MRAAATDLARRAALLAVCLAAFSAAGQTMYKWVGPDGQTHYADKPPKGFAGPVTKIETDPAPPRPPAAARTAKPPVDAGEEKPAVDLNKARRERRERLEAAVEQARERLALARKALAEGADPGEGELQVIQQRYPQRRGKEAPRGNCMSRPGADGKPGWTCPTVIPGEGYFERQKSLEEAVRKAEEALEAAELAWRRGVD